MSRFRGPYVPPSPHRTQKMVDMHLRGIGVDQIGAVLGVYGQTVASLLRKAGFSARPIILRDPDDFEHASADIWTPERMWHQIRSE